MDIVSKPNNDRHVLSFSRKLFLSVISLFLVFAVCFIAYQYQREKEYKVELLDTQLQDYNERLQQELRSTPDSLWTSVLNQYIVKGANKDLRVTIVNLHGDVLYDSYNETSQEVFNNHMYAVLPRQPEFPISIRPLSIPIISSVQHCPTT